MGALRIRASATPSSNRAEAVDGRFLGKGCVDITGQWMQAPTPEFTIYLLFLLSFADLHGE